MPTLVFKSRDTCPLCRCRVAALNIGTYRINKDSFVATSPALMACPQWCRECGFPVGTPTRWWPDPESEQVIARSRAKRGWAA